MLAHCALVLHSAFHTYISTELGETFIKDRLILIIFSAEGESSNNTGASETQPSGEFCGDSKISVIYNATL